MLNYRKTDPSFPHQPTADQWFDETQFESYRSLGYDIGTIALSEAAGKAAIKVANLVRHDVAKLCAAIEQQWRPGQRTSATVEGRQAG